MGVKGDMKGDGFQNGGTVIVKKGGKLIFEHLQEDAAELCRANSVFKFRASF